MASLRRFAAAQQEVCLQTPLCGSIIAVACCFRKEYFLMSYPILPSLISLCAFSATQIFGAVGLIMETVLFILIKSKSMIQIILWARQSVQLFASESNCCKRAGFYIQATRCLLLKHLSKPIKFRETVKVGYKRHQT